MTVIDAGSLATVPPAPAGGRTVLVIRGPSYLALHTAIGHPELHADGVVIVAEPGRALCDLDVTEILAIPVLATVPVRADIFGASVSLGATTWPLRPTSQKRNWPLRPFFDQQLQRSR